MSEKVQSTVVSISGEAQSFDRLFLQLRDSLTGDDTERSAWAAYHLGTGCLRSSKLAAGTRWLESCLQRSDTLEILKLDCLLQLEEAHRGGSPERVVEVSEQAMVIARRLGKGEHLVAALYRLAHGLQTLGFIAQRQMAVDDLENLSRYFSSRNPATFHFVSTLFRVCQGESALGRASDEEAAYEEFLRALNHLQFLPDIDLERNKYLNLQREGRSLWPSKCVLALEVGVEILGRLRRLRRTLGKEATNEEILLDKYLSAASKTWLRSVNTSSLVELRQLLNDSLSRNCIEDAESYGAELLKAAVTDDMSKYKTAAVGALQKLAIVCYRYHAANFRGNTGAFQMIDSFLTEAESLALSGDLTSYLSLRRDRAFYTMSYGKDADWKRAVMDDLRHVLEMERRVGSAGDERIRLLEDAREFFYEVQQRYLEWTDPPQVSQALLWAERGRARDALHQLAVENDFDHDVDLFDRDDDWGWKEVESVCCQHKTSVFLMFSRPGNDVYAYFLHADEEPRCMKVKMSHSNCFEMLYNLLFRGRSKDRRLRQGLLTLLYGLLIQPWEERLERIKPERLVILPEKELSFVPFPALRVPENKLDVSPERLTTYKSEDIERLWTGEQGDEYLIERYEVAVAPSLRMFSYCEQRRRALVEARQGELKAVLVVNPTLDLSEAEDEAAEVEECLSSCGFEVKCLKGREATRESVAEALMSGCDWAHFATHGYLDDKFPRGALLLAGGQQGGGGGGGMFERVTGVQLVPESLKAQAVVLSSCTSGVGLEMYPEGNLGLPRCFHMAGVPTCVASLWKVDDQSTRTLMQHFYESLGEGGCVSKAMQDAMKLMIHGDEDELSGDPEYDVIDWAGFYVSGAASSAILA